TVSRTRGSRRRGVRGGPPSRRPCTGGIRRAGCRGRTRRRDAPRVARAVERTSGDKGSWSGRGPSDGLSFNVPLSRGMRGDEPLDLRSPPREFLLRPAVVCGHAPQGLRPRPLGAHPADVVLASEGAPVLSLVVPEVQVSAPTEIADPHPASDLHHSYL